MMFTPPMLNTIAVARPTPTVSVACQLKDDTGPLMMDCNGNGPIECPPGFVVTFASGQEPRRLVICRVPTETAKPMEER